MDSEGEFKKAMMAETPAVVEALVIFDEPCAACSHMKPGTVEVTTGEHAGERVCQDCLNLLIRAARLGRDDGKRVVEAQQRIAEAGSVSGLRRRHHKLQ